MDTFLQDVRYAVRMLIKNRGVTLVALLALALGIGASTAIFSAVNPVLFEPLPYPHSDRVAMVWDFGPAGSRQEVAFGTYRELAARNREFEAVAVVKPWQPTLTGLAEPERLEGQRVSSSYFRVLGVRPEFGQDFDAVDDRLNGPNVAILSDNLWRRRFSSDRSIVGRQVSLDDVNFTVIGVMPHAFENVPAPAAELWTLLQYDTSQGRAWGKHLRMIGRLRPGIRMEHARQELNVIAKAPVAEFPRVSWASLTNGLILSSLQEEVTRGVKPALIAVFGAAILLLLIACVNVTNLLFARSSQRRGEFAIRSALGAPKTRLIRQLLTESLLLAVVGGALGIDIAAFGVSALVALSPPGLPRVSAIRLDGTVLAFAVGVTTLVGVIVGLIPAWHASHGELHTEMQGASRRTTGGHHLTRRVLVVAQFALALVLLVGAGLLLRTVQRLFAVPPGFDTSRLLTMQVQTSGHRYDDARATYQFFREALEAVRGVPGVTAAAFTSQLPLSGENDEYGARFESGEVNQSQGGYSVFRYAVSPGYFETTGIPLRRGRLLEARDVAGAPFVVLISESLARQQFRDQDPIGHRLQFGPTDQPSYTIVGVVGDVKQTSLTATQSDAAYITPEQCWFADSAMSLVVRARSDAAALTPAVRRAIWSVDKDRPITRVATVEQLLAATTGERRFALSVFESFALVALALAAIGIYGVVSYIATQRTHEVGVRMALGAQPRDILILVLRQGMRMVMLGLATGLIAAVALTQTIEKLLYGVTPMDPVTYIAVVSVLIAVALAACWLPARRASRVDPMIALRYE